MGGRSRGDEVDIGMWYNVRGVCGRMGVCGELGGDDKIWKIWDSGGLGLGGAKVYTEVDLG